MAKKFLGVTDLEIDTLCAAILTALRGAPLHPGQLKVAIGGAVRDLGAEGKRRGQATTLSLGLGKLQSGGKIRRIPFSGRIDQQRFSYALWDQIVDDSAEPFAKLAELFFTWIGPAHVREFQWFSGLGVATSRAAISELDLVDIGRGLLLPKGLTEEFFAFKVPIQPDVRLLSLLDSLFLLKRTFETLIDDPDIGNKIGGRGLSDLEYNVITDRGTIVGVWEYEQRSAQIAYHVFGPVESAHKEAIHRTEDYVRDQLGDARCYSLDSPESRQPKIEQIRAWN